MSLLQAHLVTYYLCAFYSQEVSYAFGWTRNNSECFFLICRTSTSTEVYRRCSRAKIRRIIGTTKLFLSFSLKRHQNCPVPDSQAVIWLLNSSRCDNGRLLRDKARLLENRVWFGMSMSYIHIFNIHFFFYLILLLVQENFW